MGVKAFPTCDGCNKIVAEPKGGVILVGSLYLADLGGDGKPTQGFMGGPGADGVQPQSCLCRNCFHKALPWFTTRKPRAKKDKPAPAQ
jgi:hypothetical protein